jgi:signal transduction histidine kinase
LLIRQSALLHLEESHLRTVYEHEVAPGQLPTVDELAKLLTQAGKYRGLTGEAPQPCDWVRLVLPLEIEQKTIGVWLLGRRDPDDFYSQAEIATLQALAHQTAIALTNITYAKRLHALYQTSIDQREIERASLGHELHDHILHQLFLLQQSAASCLDLPPFAQAYATITRSLRDLIRGLRPPMLEYGLYEALVALADDWTQRSSNQPGPLISLEVPESDVRYVLHVEQHLYRIVQQAGENALRHARAQTLRLYGCLEPDRVELTIEDDGQGFDAQKRLDLNQPESRSHFGLIGMRERAALINAQIQFDSEPGQGTRVHFQWRPES